MRMMGNVPGQLEEFLLEIEGAAELVIDQGQVLRLLGGWSSDHLLQLQSPGSEQQLAGHLSCLIGEIASRVDVLWLELWV